MACIVVRSVLQNVPQCLQMPKPCRVKSQVLQNLLTRTIKERKMCPLGFTNLVSCATRTEKHSESRPVTTNSNDKLALEMMLLPDSCFLPRQQLPGCSTGPAASLFTEHTGLQTM